MEATPFEMILVPVCQTTIATVAACWLLSVLAGGVKTLLRSAFGRSNEADRSFDPRPTPWCSPGADPWISGPVGG